MIQVIGIKRFIVLLVLLLVNVALGASIYFYTIPEKKKMKITLSGIRQGVAQVQSDIDRMQIEFEQLDQQQGRFDQLEADGFFSTQVRNDAKNLLSAIQDDAKVVSAVVSVKSGIVMDDSEAEKANHKILFSPIEITLEAFDDASIYEYLTIAEERFPGHLSLDAIKIQRTRDVSSPVLRAIASGANSVLITAEVIMSWRTMIPDSQVILDKNKR